jgi:hypothetical protein
VNWSIFEGPFLLIECGIDTDLNVGLSPFEILHLLLHGRTCMSNVLWLGVLISLGFVCHYWLAVVFPKLVSICLHFSSKAV